MHRSRIGVVLIDHPVSEWDRGLAFWAGVQGVEPAQEDVDVDDPYRSIGRLGILMLESQRVGEGTPARVHLDIETDDVVAEVARVIALGARVVVEHDSFTVLEDPTGLVFCAVPVQTGADFDDHALTWD